MRHFRLPGTVAALARGVGVATTQTPLIAPPGFTHAMGTRLARTLAGAVALTAVAVAAAEHRCAAVGAEVASSWGFHRQERADGCSTGSGDSWNTFHATSPAWARGATSVETCRFGPVSRLLPKAGNRFTAPALRALLQQPDENPPACPSFACYIHFTGRAIAGALPVALRAPYNAPAIASNQIPLRSCFGSLRLHLKLTFAARFTPIPTAVHNLTREPLSLR
jgi:hypothetical protein